MASNIEHPLQTNDREDHSHSSSGLNKEDAHVNYQGNNFLGKTNDELPPVHRPRGKSFDKRDVAESFGSIAGGLFDFGAKTATAAIASIQNQYEVHRNTAIDHPLQNEDLPSNVRDSGRADQSDDYVINYRPSTAKPPKQGQSFVMQMAIGECDESLEGDESPEKKTENMVQFPINEKPSPTGEELPEQDFVEQLIASDYKEGFREEGLNDSITSKMSASNALGESIHKKPKELATMLEKSVSTLLRHFNDQLSIEADYKPQDGGPIGNGVIPDDIWDAMAEIDLVRKELLSQAALATMGDNGKSCSSLRSSGNSGSGRRQGRRPSWKL